MLDLTADDSDGLYYLDESLCPSWSTNLLSDCGSWSIARHGKPPISFGLSSLRAHSTSGKTRWTASALKERDLARSRWILIAPIGNWSLRSSCLRFDR